MMFGEWTPFALMAIVIVALAVIYWIDRLAISDEAKAMTRILIALGLLGFVLWQAWDFMQGV